MASTTKNKKADGKAYRPKITSVLSFLGATTFSFWLQPCFAAKINNFNSQSNLSQPVKDGENLIQEMYNAAAALQDYSLVFETLTFKKGKTIQEKGRLYFKKPKLMRLEEIGEYQKGAIVVIGADGKARVRPGGLAGFLTLTMKADDKQLDAANGDRMLDSDYLSLAGILKERLKQGQMARVSERLATTPGISQPTHILEIYDPVNPKLTIKRIYVSPQSKLPVRWDDYDYKYPCTSTWSEVKTNAGLADSLFRL